MTSRKAISFHKNVLRQGKYVKLSLPTLCRHVGGTEVYLHPFLSTTPDRGERWTSRPGRFTPLKEPRCPLNRGLGGPQVRSGRFGEEKHVWAPSGFEPCNAQPVAQLLYRLSHLSNKSVLKMATINKLTTYKEARHADVTMAKHLQAWSHVSRARGCDTFTNIGPQHICCTATTEVFRSLENHRQYFE